MNLSSEADSWEQPECQPWRRLHLSLTEVGDSVHSAKTVSITEQVLLFTESAKTQHMTSVDAEAAERLESVRQRVIQESQRWRTQYDGESNHVNDKPQLSQKLQESTAGQT